MDDERMIRTLAAKAATEPTPAVDVTGRVMAVLAESGGKAGARIDRALVWCAACSAVLAVVLAVAGYAALDTLLDPLVDNFNSLTWVTP